MRHHYGIRLKIEALSEEVSRMIFQLVTIILHRDLLDASPKWSEKGRVENHAKLII